MYVTMWYAGKPAYHMVTYLIGRVNCINTTCYGEGNVGKFSCNL